MFSALKNCFELRPGAGPALRIACLLALFALACTTPLTVNEERRLGQQTLQQVQGQVQLVQDPAVVRYVSSIGQKLVAAAGPQPFPYQFFVIEASSINAFALPGGSIFVHTETILRARNVSELAGVLGHEVGHVVRRHIANNYHRQQSVVAAQQVGVIVTDIFVGQGAAELVNLGSGLAGMAYLNTFSREDERDADQFALRVMPRAGYDPHGLASFFEVLQADHSDDGAPEFMRSHPATRERLESARRGAASAMRPGLVKTDRGRLQRVQDRLRVLRKRAKPAQKTPAK